METISQACIFVLETEYPQIQSLKDKESLYKARAKVVRLAHLYQFKFSEHFEGYADTYFQKIWDQISNNMLTADRECERLVFAVVRYLGEAASLPNYKDFIK